VWLDARPKRVPGGYVCDLCPEDTRLTYPTPKESGKPRYSNSSLKWVNGDLRNAFPAPLIEQLGLGSFRVRVAKRTKRESGRAGQALISPS
jgi:hypothetical protein